MSVNAAACPREFTLEKYGERLMEVLGRLQTRER
jgi:hypothetical protein